MSMRGSAWVYAVAGIAGACSMTLELSAVRLVAPWFGTSSAVWTHVIGVVLLALSSGYMLGAWLSRGERPARGLGLCLLAAAAATAWLPAAASPVASWFRPADVALDEAADLLQWGSLACAFLLFLPPTLLLGCVPPLSTEIVQRSGGRSAGDAGGRVLAVSTIGSIVGTFATTYLVLPGLGLTRTYLGAGVLLAAIACLPLVRGARGPGAPGSPSSPSSIGLAPLLLALPVLLATKLSRLRAPSAPEGWRIVATAESAYQSLRVVEGEDGGRKMRRLQVNEGLDSFQSVWQESPGLLPDGYYYNLFALPAWWSPRRESWRVFVLGLGAGTTSRVLEGALPPGETLVSAGAEIDPQAVALGERWFDLPVGDPARRVLSGWDARMALRHQAAVWDEIVLDAYANQMEIPAHLCSREFFAQVRARLAPGGWLCINVGGFGLRDPVVEAVARTAADAFARRLLALRVPFSRNCVLFVRADSEPPAPGEPGWYGGNGPLDTRLSALALEGSWRWFEPGSSPILTDDHNPVDRLQRESIRRGRSLWLSAP